MAYFSSCLCRAFLSLSACVLSRVSSRSCARFSHSEKEKSASRYSGLLLDSMDFQRGAIPPRPLNPGEGARGWAARSTAPPSPASEGSGGAAVSAPWGGGVAEAVAAVTPDVSWVSVVTRL